MIRWTSCSHYILVTVVIYVALSRQDVALCLLWQTVSLSSLCSGSARELQQLVAFFVVSCTV